MKIAYVSHTRYPTEKAHGHQITRVCEALAILGHKLTLVVPGVHNEIREAPQSYYDIEAEFAIEKLPTKDALLSSVIPGRFAMLFTMRSYRRALRSYFASQSFDLLYARSPHVVPALLCTGMPVVLELHTLPRRGKRYFVRLCKQCTLVVCLTSRMKEELVAWGVPETHVMVEGDAVSLDLYRNIKPHDFSLPTNRPIVGYIGSLSTMDDIDKGAALLLKCAKSLKDSHNAFVFIVGGPVKKAKEYREFAKRLGLSEDDVRIEGPIPSSLVPAAISSCDVCVYPAPISDNPYFQRDTSPLKLFEYMASGIPIVCADIPPVWDVLATDMALFAPPGNPDALAEQIDFALSNKEEVQKRAAKASEAVKRHTWKKRMQRILTAVSAQ